MCNPESIEWDPESTWNPESILVEPLSLEPGIHDSGTGNAGSTVWDPESMGGDLKSEDHPDSFTLGEKNEISSDICPPCRLNHKFGYFKYLFCIVRQRNVLNACRTRTCT